MAVRIDLFNVKDQTSSKRTVVLKFLILQASESGPPEPVVEATHEEPLSRESGPCEG